MKNKKEKKVSEQILEVKNLHKTYHAESSKPIFALKNINLKIMKGRFVALMGRSGSGKSTFLHQVALLDKATKGEIWIGGKKVSEMNENQKSNFRLDYIGYIFQDYALLPELTLYENVALPMIAQGIVRDKYHDDVMDVIKKVGLEEWVKHLPGELSGGQQQRVSIARAIVNKPAILYADEPTANLDSEASKNILETLRELVDKYNQTIIMVTHEPEDEKIVDEVIWLKDGEMESHRIK